MELFYREYGNGRSLVILHGLFGISDNWTGLAKKYAEEFHVILPDLRNHGQSGHSREFSIDIMAADVFETLDKAGVSDFLLMGHSLGGKVAMEMSFQAGDRVKALVVADIAPKAYAPHHQQILKALHAVDPETLKSRGEAEERMMPFINDYSVRQFLLKNLYWKEDKLSWRMNVWGIEENIEEVGKETRKMLYGGPVLFIKGSESGYIKEEDREDILSRFPRAEIFELEGAGHWVHAEKPVDFFNKTKNFLEEAQK